MNPSVRYCGDPMGKPQHRRKERAIGAPGSRSTGSERHVFTGIVIGAVVAVIGTVAAFLLPRIFPSTSRDTDHLETADMSVDQPASHLSHPATRSSSKASYVAGPGPTLDFSIRNTGKVDALLTNAVFKVAAFAHLDNCDTTPQSALDPSENYDATLPLFENGQLSSSQFTVPVHEVVPAQKEDRFTITLGPAGGSPDVSLGSTIYRLKVSISFDGKARLLELGYANIVDREPWLYIGESTVRDPLAGPFLACIAGNRRTVESIVRLGGSTSPILSESSFGVLTLP